MICHIKKGDFLNVSTFLHPQIPDFQIVVSQPILSYPNKPYINGKLIYPTFT